MAAPGISVHQGAIVPAQESNIYISDADLRIEIIPLQRKHTNLLGRPAKMHGPLARPQMKGFETPEAANPIILHVPARGKVPFLNVLCYYTVKLMRPTKDLVIP